PRQIPHVVQLALRGQQLQLTPEAAVGGVDAIPDGLLLVRGQREAPLKLGAGGTGTHAVHLLCHIGEGAGEVGKHSIDVEADDAGHSRASSISPKARIQTRGMTITSPTFETCASLPYDWARMMRSS